MKGNPLAQINGRKTLDRIGLFDNAQARSAAIVYKDAAKKAAIARLSRNGITPKDLEDEFKRGYDTARKELTGFTMRMFYCAIGLATHELYGHGETRIIRTLDRVQEIMTEEICTADIMQRLKQETGIDIFDTEYDN